jgi:beta-lactamase superfamily II metal-dependent hydrolase
MISGDTYGVLNRLILNEKITPSPEGVMRILGFVHLYTASGLHLIALESFLQRFFGKTIKSRKFLTVVFWLFIFLIWKVQGFRPGFARIVFIFLLKALAKENGFIWRRYIPLFLAFCFDFVFGTEAGWQHYYLAILGGMIGMQVAEIHHRGELMKHFYLSVGSWLLTAPLDLMEHHTISWMTPIWSMLTIPVISIILYPLSVVSFFIFGDVPSWITSCWNQGLEFLFQFVDLGFTFSVVDHRILFISLGLSILAYIVCRRPLHYVLFILGFLCVRFHPWYQDNKIHLVQLNVGQGDSLLLRKGNRVEMVDVGPSQNLKPEIMIHRLAESGVNHVDTVLLSHLDDDHAGGLKFLLPWVPLGVVQVSPEFDRVDVIQDWLSQAATAEYCSDGCFKLGIVDWIHVSDGGKKLNHKNFKKVYNKKTIRRNPGSIISRVKIDVDQDGDPNEIKKAKFTTYLDWYESGGDFKFTSPPDFDDNSRSSNLSGTLPVHDIEVGFSTGFDIANRENAIGTRRENSDFEHLISRNRNVRFSTKGRSVANLLSSRKKLKKKFCKSKKSSKGYSGNDLMGVVMIPLSDESIYLSLGDSNVNQENKFWKRHHDFVKKFMKRYLKISHHGSHSSSDIEFIDKIRPELAIISVGKRNRYHHPHFSVLENLRVFGLRIHRTDRDGSFHISGK